VRRVRRMTAAGVALAALAVPGTAAAHARGPTVALDYRVNLPAVPLPGVRAAVLDGDRSLRLRLDPRTRLVVRGLLGEPVLRFGASGVWVNRASPTAAADKLTTAGRGWKRLTTARAYVWHDHRLAPPPGLHPGERAPFRLPVLLNGRAAAITGAFERVPRPGLWPWLVGAAVLLGVLAAAAYPVRRRVAAASVVAMAAALGAVAVSAGVTTSESLGGATAWIELASAIVLAVAAAAVLARSSPATRAWTATVVGAVAAALSLGSLSVFWHGVVVSSLPPTAARIATAVAVLGGCTAAVLGTLAARTKQVRR
jgi:hypothetical protein